MTDTWFFSDPHFGHANILKFVGPQGYVRPGFDDVDHMNEVLLENYNSLVKPQDKVYFLGDVVWRTQDARILKKMHGNKRLTVGNHDRVKDVEWAFEKIMLWQKFEANGVKFIASHCPLNEDDMVRTTFSVHGHLHERTLKLPDGTEDPRYLNVCVERTGYKPINMDTVTDLLKLG